MEKRKKYGGRKKGSVNKTTAEIRQRAQEHADKALARLIYLVEHGTTETAQLPVKSCLIAAMVARYSKHRH